MKIEQVEITRYTMKYFIVSSTMKMGNNKNILVKTEDLQVLSDWDLSQGTGPHSMPTVDDRH